MGHWKRPEPDLFKRHPSSLAPPQRKQALELIKTLLKEAMPAAGAENQNTVHQEANDEQQ
jgi:hypothetical protein